MFVSTHYAGKEVSMRFGVGEAWKKVFGPVFIYLNSDPVGSGPGSLWEDAKNQVFFFFLIFMIRPLFIGKKGKLKNGNILKSDEDRDK